MKNLENKIGIKNEKNEFQFFSRTYYHILTWKCSNIFMLIHHKAKILKNRKIGKIRLVGCNRFWFIVFFCKVHLYNSLFTKKNQKKNWKKIYIKKVILTDKLVFGQRGHLFFTNYQRPKMDFSNYFPKMHTFSSFKFLPDFTLFSWITYTW